MFPTLLDRKTGRTAMADQFDTSLYWWAEGNGSCDCNRAIAMGEDVHEELEAIYGEGICFGSRRIIAVDVHGDLEGMSKEEALEWINHSYSEETAVSEEISDDICITHDEVPEPPQNPLLLMIQVMSQEFFDRIMMQVDQAIRRAIAEELYGKEPLDDEIRAKGGMAIDADTEAVVYLWDGKPVLAIGPPSWNETGLQFNFPVRRLNKPKILTRSNEIILPGL